MATEGNIRISDLPLAVLPLDGPNSFFEVQTVEGGVPVSRRVASDNIVVGFVTPTIDNSTLRGDLSTGQFVETNLFNIPDNTNNTLVVNGASAADADTGFNIDAPPNRDTFLQFLENGIATYRMFYDAANSEARHRLNVPGVIQLEEGDASVVLAEFDSTVGQVRLWAGLAGVDVPVARTILPAAGGMEVDNQLTGAGFERVLTTSDALGAGGQVNTVVGGTNISVNAADPINPIVNLDAAITGVSVNGVTLTTGGLATNFLNAQGNYVAVPAGGGQVDTVVGGANVTVDATDPVNPIVNLDAAITGVSVNGVTLSAAGAATNFLNETGAYGEVSSLLDSGTVRVAATSLGGQITGTTLDVNNSAAVTPVAAFLRNSEGGVRLVADNGGFNIQQTDSIGGSLENWIQCLVNGAVTLFNNNNPRISATTTGASVTATGATQLVVLESGANIADVIARNSAGGFAWRTESTGAVNLYQVSGVGAFEDVWMGFIRDGSVALRHNNVNMARTAAAAAGGFEVNNTVTGSGFERVLTTSDAAGGSLPSGSQFDTLYISTAPNTYSATSALSVNPGVLITATDDVEINKTSPAYRFNNTGGPGNDGEATITYLDVIFFDPRLEIRIDTGAGGSNALVFAAQPGVVPVTEIYQPGAVTPTIRLINSTPEIQLSGATMGLEPSTAANSWFQIDSGSTTLWARVELANIGAAVALEWDNNSDTFTIGRVNAGGGAFTVGGLGLELVLTGSNRVRLYEGVNVAARTTEPSSGGLEANNTVTGSGLERVLTTSDLVQSAVKAASTARANTITRSDDPDLSGFALEPSTSYIVEVGLVFNGGGATGNGFRWAFDFNGQIGNVNVQNGIGISVQQGGNTETVNTIAGNGIIQTKSTFDAAGVDEWVTISFGLVTGASYVSGTPIDLEWAQGTSLATATTLEAGSYMKVTRVA